MHRHMAGTLHHHLDIMFPGKRRQLSKCLQLSELGLIIGVGNRARAQPVSQGEGHIIGFHDLANVLKMRI
ncbi:hypothetical protein D3C75_966590 [compost metagenome]